MKKIFQFLLKIITILLVRKYSPTIIAITGSVGKTSTKDGVYEAFCDWRRTRKSSGNLNTEIGAPLVFLGEKRAGRGIKEWALIFLKGLLLLLKRDKDYPEIVVAELAADKPGDIEYLSGFIKPDIAVVTAVGKVPVHIEFYRNADEVAKEKEKLVMALSQSGKAILNADDPYVSQMQTKAEKITFGTKKDADVVIKDFKSTSTDGSSLTLSYQGKDYPLFLSKCIGDSFAYVAASVFAVGISLGIEPKRLSKRLSKIRPANGRQQIIKGKKETIILDGSYNAAPSSMMSALRALKDLPGKRKIAVLGDMLELGRFSNEEHRKIGRFAAEFCDYIFSVGEWKEEIKRAAIHAGMKEENIFVFSKSEQVIDELEKIILEKDIILVKGSQGIRMERIVFAIMRDPERAEELLIRQESPWKNKK